MTLVEFTQHWQALLDRHPTRSKGWIEERFQEVAAYRSPDDVYFLPAVHDANGVEHESWQSEQPNNSGIRFATVGELQNMLMITNRKRT